MGITKDQLFFDPANPNDGDTGSNYVRGADGTVIGNTGDALKVTGNFNVDGSTVALDAPTLAALENITVSATDLDTRDLAFATDKVDVTGSEVSLDAASLAALENITVTVDNIDFDIRDLAFATDKVDVTGSEVSLDAATLAALESITVSGTVELGASTLAALETINVTDGGGSLTVDAIDFDIRDLTHVSDSMKIGDGTDFMEVNADGSINVAAQIANSIKNTAFTATTTPAAIIGTALSGRRLITIQNLGNKDAYIGESTVTTGTGIVVPAGSSAEFPWGESISPYAVTESATANLRILETSYV